MRLIRRGIFWIGLTVAVVSAALIVQASGRATAPYSSPIVPIPTKACCEKVPANAGIDDTRASVISVDETFFTVWKEPQARAAIKFSHIVTRHDGTKINTLDLAGQPLAVTFAYTRCTNPNKCARVAQSMAQLARLVSEAGLDQRVKLIVISYDPERDTPQDLVDYSKKHSFPLSEKSLFLRPEVDPSRTLFRDLGVAASFDSTGVSMHGIQLLLIDKHCRLARSYQTTIWNNAQVVEDLKKLVAEEF